MLLVLIISWILFLVLVLSSKLKKPNGILYINQYTNKTLWNFKVLDPIDDFKDKRKVIFEIRETTIDHECPEDLD